MVLGLGLFVAGCAGAEVVVVHVEARLKPLPYGAAFTITAAPPPRPALYLGQVAFATPPARLEDCLAEVRERLRRLGANLVAGLRCRDAVPGDPAATPGVQSGDHYRGAARAHCHGRFFRLVLVGDDRTRGAQQPGAPAQSGSRQPTNPSRSASPPALQSSSGQPLP